MKQKSQNLLIFLFITAALLIAINLYCHLIKYWAKQKHLLPYTSQLEKVLS